MVEPTKKQLKKYEKWRLKLEENVKRIYDYDKSCIEFLEKYNIAEKEFM